MYQHAGQFEKSIEQLRRAVDIAPGNAQARGGLAMSYAAAGLHRNSIEQCEMALGLSRRDPVLILHAAAYAMLGETAKARRLLQEVERNLKPDGASSFWIANVHACMGEKDAAFEWLEKALQEHAAFLIWGKFFVSFPESFRDDPRFDSRTDGSGGIFKMIGETISHYRIVEKLGGRGMGIVYSAKPKPRPR